MRASLCEAAAVIYLDHAATTPISDVAWRAMEPYLREHFGNPSEPHAAGRAARAGLDAARASVAATLGCAETEVVFTGGGSEADNLAILGRLAGGGRVVASAIEHPAVREPLRAYGGEVAWAPVGADGVVDLDALRQLVRPGDALCCVMAANNVTGVLQPVAEIAALCAEREVPLHVDAVQAASGAEVRALPGRTTLALAAHKLGGPKGVGALVGPGVADLAVVLRGGGQEHGLRPGTENVAGAVALAAVLARRQAPGAGTERRARAALRDRLERAAAVPVAAAGAPRLPGHALLLADVRGDLVVHQLDGDGICVAAGSACAAGSTEPSHVLEAMGIDAATARGAVRVTLGPETTADDVDAFLAAFGRIRHGLRRAAESVA
jgi:cysteine desulfurase